MIGCQADHLFTANMADGNKERALLLMTNHVKAANAIYKNTGFAIENEPEGMKTPTYYTVVVSKFRHSV